MDSSFSEVAIDAINGQSYSSDLSDGNEEATQVNFLEISSIVAIKYLTPKNPSKAAEIS